VRAGAGSAEHPKSGWRPLLVRCRPHQGRPDNNLSLDPPRKFRCLSRCASRRISDLDGFPGAAFPPLACSVACPGARWGGAGGWPLGPGSCRDWVWAGQAAVAGGPQAAWNKFIHPVSRCQPSGRCSAMWRRPWREMRAATAISWPRMVAPRALALKAPARQPTARVRLWQMAARAQPRGVGREMP
jgi:hypothetical protein